MGFCNFENFSPAIYLYFGWALCLIIKLNPHTTDKYRPHLVQKKGSMPKTTIYNVCDFCVLKRKNNSGIM